MKKHSFIQRLCPALLLMVLPLELSAQRAGMADDPHHSQDSLSSSSQGSIAPSDATNDPDYDRKKAAESRRLAAQERAAATGPQAQFHNAAAQAYENAALQYDQAARRAAARKTQELISSQQNQQQQLQNSFNKLADQVGESMRSKNNGNQSDEPSAVWDENRQEYRSKDGGPPPIITYRKPDGSVDYSGIPVEAIDPSAQVDVYYRRGRSTPQSSSPSPTATVPYSAPQRLTDLLNNSPDSGTSVLDGSQPSPKGSIFSELAQSQGLSQGSTGFGSPTDVNNASSGIQSPGDSTGRLQAAGDSARELFGDATQVAKATGRTLTDELFGQVRNGETVNIREAAKAGINSTLDQMKGQAVGILDDGIRSLIRRLPEDKRFDNETFYNTFVSPKTQVPTPFKLKENFEPYFEELFGKPVDQVSGSPSH